MLVYLLQARAHPTPWLFPDELENAQLSRAIAATGHAARRGAPSPYLLPNLYPVLIAPAWWLRSTHSGYEVAKAIGVVVMTATLLPAYWLARLAVPRSWAVAAAIGSVTVPALYFSSLLLKEPIAYPFATLCFFLSARALARPGRRSLAAAVAAVAVAPLVRPQLALLPLVLALALLLDGRGGRASASPRRLSSALVLAVAMAALGGCLAFLLSKQHAHLIEHVARHPRLVVKDALWSFGSLSVGIAVIPSVFGLALAFRRRRNDDLRGYAALRYVLLAALVLFVPYAGGKAVYLGRSLYSIEERDLIYLTPLLVVTTAVVLHARVRLTSVPAAAAAGVVLAASLVAPHKLDSELTSDAPGLAVLALAHRSLGVGNPAVDVGLCVLAAVSLIVLLGRGSVSRPVVVALSGLVVAWSLTGEIAASNASARISRAFLASIPSPPDWVDEQTTGPVVLLGNQIVDPIPVSEIEFWNRSIRHVTSLDGSAPGPGPAPELRPVSLGGELRPTLAGRYLLTEGAVDPAAQPIEVRTPWHLYRFEGRIRLRSAVLRSSPGTTTYERFGSPSLPTRIVLSVAGSPTGATVTVGRLALRGSAPAVVPPVTVRSFAVTPGRALSVEVAADCSRLAIAVRLTGTGSLTFQYVRPGPDDAPKQRIGYACRKS